MAIRQLTSTFLVFLSVACGIMLFGHSDKKQKASGEVAVIDTNMGRITFRFFEQESPRMVQRFKELARAGSYDETIFSRVLPGLQIQGGVIEDGTEKAGPVFEPLEVEGMGLKHIRGAVSMACERADSCRGSQFFICLQTVTYYDGRHTVIGEVISGMKVADAISAVPRNALAAPLFTVRIRKISIETQDYFIEK